VVNSSSDRLSIRAIATANTANDQHLDPDSHPHLFKSLFIVRFYH